MALSAAEWAELSPEEQAEYYNLKENLLGGESLGEFMTRMAPARPPPEHLLPLIDVIEEARVTRNMKVGISMPPGHVKTYLFQHAFAWWLKQFPADQCGYNSYNSPQALLKSDETRVLAARAGVKLSEDTNSKAVWKTQEGGGLFAGGMESLTGKRVQGPLVIDDPYAGPEDAFSPAYRERAFDDIQSVAMTRREGGAPLFLIHCVARGEPVLMADGTWRPVESVRAGESVVAFENGAFVPRPVLAHRSSGDDDILEVRTARKTLRVNARHPFLGKNGWIKAGDLKAGDQVAVTTDGIGTDRADEDFAWFFGFMMGDGWVTRWKRLNKKPSGTVSKTESLCVCAALSKDDELNARVLSAMERHLGATPRVTKFGYARIDANAAGRRLIELGLVGGAHGKRIPAWVFRLSPEGKVAYLHGHAAADGHRLKKSTESWRISSVSRALVDDLRLLAISAGVRVGRIGSFRQVIKAPHSKAPKEYECFGVTVNFAKPPDPFESIESVTPAGRAEVFDLTVDGAENFVAGGYVVHNTRWHPDDAIGRFKRMQREGKISGWRFINLPAISPKGALWPAMYPLETLNSIRGDVGEYNFSALYQGEPRPRGASLFGDPGYYDPAKTSFEGCRTIIAGDPAASTKTSADYSTAVVLSVRGYGADRVGYVRYVYRKQVPVPQYADDLAELQMAWGMAPIHVEAVGGFKAVPQILRALGVSRLVEIIPEGDKFQRAQKAAAAWNGRPPRLLVPSDSPPWLGPFLDELAVFTGDNDAHDDQVDALAHGWNASPAVTMFDAVG